MTTTRPPAPLTAGALVFGYGRDSGGADQERSVACRQDPPPVTALLVWDLARISRAQLDRQFYISDLRRRGIQVL